MSVKTIFCRNITALIERKGLTHNEAGKILGYTSGAYVSQIASGKASISERQARKIIKVLGGTEQDLYQGIIKTYKEGLNDLEKSIFDNIKELPDGTRLFIAGLIEAASLIKHFDRTEQELISFYRNCTDKQKDAAYHFLEAMSAESLKDKERAGEERVEYIDRKIA